MKHLYVLFLLGISFLSLSQSTPKGKLSGQIMEATTTNPIPFSSIRIQTENPVKLITGTIANDKGEFSIDVSQGIYDIVVESVGFEVQTLKQIQISKSTNLGQIQVKASTQTLAEVTVKGQNLAWSFRWISESSMWELMQPIKELLPRKF